MIDIGEGLVLAEQFSVDVCSISGLQTKTEEGLCLLWLVEFSNALWSETNRSCGSPLCVISAATKVGEGVEFEELTLRENGKRNALCLLYTSPSPRDRG